MEKGFFYTLLFCLAGFAGQLHSYQGTDNTSIFFADLLVFKVRAASMENWAQNISPPGTATRTAQLLDIPFQWKPGVRLGIRHQDRDNDWHQVFSYTHFQSTGSHQAAVATGGIYSPFLGNFFMNNATGAGFGPNYHDASIRWKVLLNVADIDVGKTFEIDPRFQLSPFVGFKGGVIQHRIDSNWQNPTVATSFTSATENLKNNFFGLGPSIGLNTTWSVYQQKTGTLNIVTQISGALLWGHWRFNDVFQTNTGTTIAVHLSPITGAASMAKGFLGVEWVSKVGKTDLKLRLGYEAQVWFNQIQYYSFNMGRLNNLMSLQGGILGLQMKF